MAHKVKNAKFDRSILKMSPDQLQAHISRTGAGIHRTSKHDVNRGASRRNAISEYR